MAIALLRQLMTLALQVLIVDQEYLVFLDLKVHSLSLLQGLLKYVEIEKSDFNYRKKA